MRLREFEREMFHPHLGEGHKKFPGTHGVMQPVSMTEDDSYDPASPKLSSTHPGGGEEELSPFGRERYSREEEGTLPPTE